MIDQYATLKDLYESIKDTDSVGYQAFLNRLRKLEEGNKEAVNRLRVGLGFRPQGRAPGQFVAYDSEGHDGKITLLANSLEDEHIYNPDGLSSLDCLEFLSTRYAFTSKRIFFSFGYDVNMFLRDLPDTSLEYLLERGHCKWEGYRISYIPGKTFTVNSFRYYDVFSFFQTSFINVVRKMLGEDRIPDTLVEGKEARGNFGSWSKEQLIAYNAVELKLLVEIMENLRDAFIRIDTRVSDWYGPGAVAKTWFKEHDTYPKEELTEDVELALRSAYYGGRFEQVSLGKIDNIYEYDINSAYPSIMSTMPNFTKWRRVTEYERHPYSVWHIDFDLRFTEQQDNSFFPLPMRSKDGRICFPMVGKGWYWNSEVALLHDFYPEAVIKVHEGYIADYEGQPFQWILDTYDYRQRLKAAGDAAEYAVKVGLNSLYGKTAQRVGKREFFSLAWAGYITSTTRSKLARAGYENGRENIIGFATDALFSRAPLKLPLSTGLGYWSEIKADSGLFMQSGVYRLMIDGEKQDRYRGSPLRKGIDDIIEQLTEHPEEDPTVKHGMFISHLLALKAPNVYGPHRLHFIQVQRVLKLGAPYKRHYEFLSNIKVVDGLPEPVYNYGRLLTEEIHSSPKVHMGDNEFFLHRRLRFNVDKFENVESYPAPEIKDKQLNNLYADAEVAMVDSHDAIDDIADLPIVVEEGEGNIRIN